ncbi:uncharacterized protein [Cherax quadricarinatus]|uniref:uncharacterized protein n=1 Tax=Cherax quadricarinatus TaxID=27406 RepID=UPI00237872BD|nr:translation initiation factor IF-2-like [Cherax quadricarinatus]
MLCGVLMESLVPPTPPDTTMSAPDPSCRRPNTASPHPTEDTARTVPVGDPGLSSLPPASSQPLGPPKGSPVSSPRPARSATITCVSPKLPPPPASPSGGRRSPMKGSPTKSSSPYSPLLARDQSSPVRVTGNGKGSQTKTCQSSVTVPQTSSTPVSVAVSGSIATTTGGAMTKFLGSAGGAKSGPGHSRSPRAPPPHRLIRQHSLAAVLGLFRGRDERLGAFTDLPDDWHTVREEPEELERSSGSNNSRSHSIPSTSVPHLPQDARRKRRSSCHTDISGMSQIIPIIPPHAIKRKPLTSEAAASAVTTRRCSLTLPYATLYGSWQSTVSAPGSRHGSNEMPSTAGPVPRRGPAVQVEMTHMGGAAPALPNSSASTQATSTTTVTTSVTTSMTTSSSTAPLLPSTPHDLLCEHGLVSLSESVTQLLACTLQKVPMKDFGSEVRASMDIAHFLSQATLVLDVGETSLEGICDMLLTKLLEQDEPLCSVAEAKSILFTHDTCEYCFSCSSLDRGGFSCRIILL